MNFSNRQAAVFYDGTRDMNQKLISRYIQPMLPIETGLPPSGCLQRPVRAVLFDIYGTLFISASGGSGLKKLEGDQRATLQQLLARHHVPRQVKTLLDDLQSEIEKQHAISRAQGIAHPEVDILQVWQAVLPRLEPNEVRHFAMEFEWIVNPVYPMPNLDRILAVCTRQAAVTGIISNAQFYTPLLFQWLLQADLRQLGFNPDLILMSYQQGLAKPSVALFEKAAARLNRRGIQPEEVLYIGNDMLKDIYPAAACGFQSALFAGDQRSLRLRRDDRRCRNLKPDLIITGLEQLLPHLAQSASSQ